MVRKYVEAVSNTIVRCARVNRQRSPREMLDATGRKQCTNSGVVEAMPRGEDEETEIFFFQLGLEISDADLEKEYALRGLVAADPYSLAAVNEADPAFADAYPNSTHWKDSADTWCYLAFDRWRGGRVVDVDRDDGVWDGHWWFAGLRK
ncbi:MAG: hypothetical protein UV34_C0022G0008 [Parcubacteria group bacterium GW2011_GWB1_42_6]|nr:MAG: hypothetical protein UV34_C0022G0008 [Parcubacteria group bacterium GW2011_GWB1_42_6]